MPSRVLRRLPETFNCLSPRLCACKQKQLRVQPQQTQALIGAIHTCARLASLLCATNKDCKAVYSPSPSIVRISLLQTSSTVTASLSVKSDSQLLKACFTYHIFTQKAKTVICKSSFFFSLNLSLARTSKHYSGQLTERFYQYPVQRRYSTATSSQSCSRAHLDV